MELVSSYKHIIENKKKQMQQFGERKRNVGKENVAKRIIFSFIQQQF